jgi:predicted Zn-dependent protease
MTSRAAAGAITGSAFLGFSREDEREADREGTRILSKAGWDARGLLMFLATAQRTGGRGPSAVSAFFSTHPSFESRIANLRADASATPHGRTDSPEFAALKRRLHRLPPAGLAPRQ